jgi:hypothetical protein
MEFHSGGGVEESEKQRIECKSKQAEVFRVGEKGRRTEGKGGEGTGVMWPKVGSREHGNKPSCSRKGEKVLDWLSDY